MSSGPRIPLHVARRIAERLARHLSPQCERIEIAGSIRRGKATVGDVELVAIPRYEELAPVAQLPLFGEARLPPVVGANLLDRLLDEMADLARVPTMIHRVPPPGIDTPPAWGPRYKKFWLYLDQDHGFLQVDLFQATAQNWGAIFAIRTGPRDFSKALVDHIRLRTPYRQGEGVVYVEATGEIVPVPEESDYFRLVGLPYIEPAHRTTPALRQMLARLRHVQRGD